MRTRECSHYWVFRLGNLVCIASNRSTPAVNSSFLTVEKKFPTQLVISFYLGRDGPCPATCRALCPVTRHAVTYFSLFGVNAFEDHPTDGPPSLTLISIMIPLCKHHFSDVSCNVRKWTHKRYIASPNDTWLPRILKSC